MDIELSQHETRILGCLLEKETTTPDQYPLSLNALTLACNQKSNRDPVMQLEEEQVQNIIDELTARRFIREESGFGSRVIKYKHRFCNTEFSELQLSPQERAILCVLFLRGSQTPGELRTRTHRLCDFGDVHQVETTLHTMSEKPGFPMVLKLPREPGKRESRYAHLFSGDIDVSVLQETSRPAPTTPIENNQRIEALEQTVALLCEEIKLLKQKVEALEE